MEPENFNGKAGIVAIPSGTTYYTFTPKTLPLELSLESELVTLLADASKELGGLDSLCNLLPNPKLLLRPYLNKEAVSSTRIEGTRSSLSDVLLYEAKKDVLLYEAKKEVERTEPEDPDLQEVLNYIDAMDYGLEKIKNSEINLPLILELHEILLKGVRGQSKDPGKIRITQNWIGLDGSDVHSATFVPPEPSKVLPLLDNLFAYMATKNKVPPLIDVGLIHYQFESIHPFRDGNGRIGRVLLILYLIKKNILTMPVLYMSPYFDKNDRQYRALLLEVSQQGDYSSWLKFFLKGVIEQAKDTHRRVTKLLDYQKTCREKLNKTRAPNSLIILESLFVNPYITVPNAKSLLKKSFPTAEHAIEVLVSHGILKEITGQIRNRVFLAEEIFKTINEPSTQPVQEQPSIAQG